VRNESESARALALPPQPATSIDLFAGAAGLTLGIKLAVPSCRTLCYVEREGYAASVLVARMEESHLDHAPVWDDVATFDGRPWRGRVDLISGGFPCQDISNAGKRAGINGNRSGLWREFARIIDETQPRFVFVENVAALASRGLDAVLGDLAALGFDAEWTTVRASDVGAPHQRNRLFVLAYSQGITEREPDNATRPLARPAPRKDSGGGSHVALLANPKHWGELERSRSPGGEEGERKPVREGLEHARQSVVDPNLARLEGRNGVCACPDEGSARKAGAASIWPPGPDDTEGWRRVLALRPDLEPAVCRMADGMAFRVDRLRLTGNGVVPAQAAAAWRLLYHRLFGRG
jgi:DNA (cytosine-5)-methyltransferase 1